LLAVLVHPRRADFAVELAEDVTDTGDYRRWRMILNDLVRSSENRITRDKAQDSSAIVFRHTSSTNVPNGGTTLKMHFKLPDEALELFQKAITADPRFRPAIL
jgi:hypothetical protein